MAGNDIASMLQNINLQKDLISQKTPEERQAEFLIGQGDALNNGSLGGAIAGGLIKGLGQVKMSKADWEKADRLAAIEAQTKQAMEYQKWVQETEQKLKTYQMAEAERAMNQTGIDEALRLTVDYGDPQALSEIVKANPGMQDVLDDTLPDGVRFEGVNFDQQNGTLVPFGRDADGNVLYGQGQKWERFASPAFMEKRAASLYESQKQEAELAKTQAEADKLSREAVSGPKAPSGYRYAGDGQTLEPIPGGPGDKPTEGQSNAALYAQRMMNSDSIINDLTNRGYSPTLGQDTIANVPGGNLLLSGDTESYQQAQRDFINAVLRRESGAVISPAEFDNAAKQYFPQVGDSASTIEQKAKNRATAINGIQRAAGPAGRGMSATYGKDAQAGGDAASIKAAYKAGQIDRATAEAQLKALGFE